MIAGLEKLTIYSTGFKFDRGITNDFDFPDLRCLRFFPSKVRTECVRRIIWYRVLFNSNYVIVTQRFSNFPDLPSTMPALQRVELSTKPSDRVTLVIDGQVRILLLRVRLETV